MPLSRFARTVLFGSVAVWDFVALVGLSLHSGYVHEMYYKFEWCLLFVGKSASTTNSNRSIDAYRFLVSYPITYGCSIDFKKM